MAQRVSGVAAWGLLHSGRADGFQVRPGLHRKIKVQPVVLPDGPHEQGIQLPQRPLHHRLEPAVTGRCRLCRKSAPAGHLHGALHPGQLQAADRFLQRVPQLCRGHIPVLLGQKHQVGPPFQVSAQHRHLPQQLPPVCLRGRAVPGQKLIHPDDLGGPADAAADRTGGSSPAGRWSCAPPRSSAVPDSCALPAPCGFPSGAPYSPPAR